MILPPEAHVSPFYLLRAATARWERDGAARLRRQVFVTEQRLFADHDRDAIDAVALPLVALSTCAAEPAEVVGTVRLHEAAPGLWWGSRLAVAEDHRRVGRLGAELIRLAVGTARARGAQVFQAQVQLRNVPLFRRLHWQLIGESLLQGIPHAHMQAELAHYPPVADPATGWAARARLPQRWS